MTMEDYERYDHGGLLNSRYVKVADVSEGSYGIVSLAKDTKVNKLVAVKYIYPLNYKTSEQLNLSNTTGRATSSPAKLRSNAESGDKVQTRASILKALYEETAKEIRIHQILGNHPNVTNLIDNFDSCLVLEYCPRGDLYEAVQNDLGPTTSQDIKDVFAQILTALEYCHSKLVFHRDLKPENILISEDWTIKICDWGLATTQREVTNKSEFDIGSERYMAPELFDTELDFYDAAKVDLWSVGVILLTLVFHKNPFQVANYTDKRFLQFSANREALFDFFSTMSGDMFSALRFCLNMDPTNRDLGSLRHELDNLKYFTMDEEYWAGHSDDEGYEEDEYDTPAPKTYDDEYGNTAKAYESDDELFKLEAPQPTDLFGEEFHHDEPPAEIFELEPSSDDIFGLEPQVEPFKLVINDGVQVNESFKVAVSSESDQELQLNKLNTSFQLAEPFVLTETYPEPYQQDNISEKPKNIISRRRVDIDEPTDSDTSRPTRDNSMPYNRRADALLSPNTDARPIPIGGQRLIRNTRKPFGVASYNKNGLSQRNGQQNSFGSKFRREDFFTPRSVFNHYMDKYGELREREPRRRKWNRGRKRQSWKKRPDEAMGQQPDKNNLLLPNGGTQSSHSASHYSGHGSHHNSGSAFDLHRRNRKRRTRAEPPLPQITPLAPGQASRGKYVPPFLRSPVKSPEAALVEEIDHLALNDGVFHLEDVDSDGDDFRKQVFAATYSIDFVSSGRKPLRPRADSSGKYIPPFRRGSHSGALVGNKDKRRSMQPAPCAPVFPGIQTLLEESRSVPGDHWFKKDWSDYE